MSIRLEVPFEALGNPDVAVALARLVESLGGLRPTAKSRRVTASPKPASRPRRAATAVDLSGLPPAERWRRYVEGRPEATIKFLALLESRGKLTVTEAVQALGLTSPKAMGGMTGAMARWAPKQGVELPFDAMTDDDGERYWVWRGWA